MDKKQINEAKQEFEKKFPINEFRNMIVSIYGDEAKNYAERFEISDHIAIKYKMIILDNITTIKDKVIIDIGCNNGLWPIVCALHGAKQVIGIEPRKMFVDPVNQYCKSQNLPVKIYQGIHTLASSLIDRYSVDTCIMMSMDDIIPNFESFIHQCSRSNIKFYIMQCISLDDDALQDSLQDNEAIAGKQIGFTVHFETHNSTLRSGINHQNDIVDQETGFQSTFDDKYDINLTKTVSNFKSQNYLRYLFETNGLQIIRDSQKHLYSNKTINRVNGKHFHWFSLQKI